MLGAATAGVGAVAGAVACGALSGAVGGLFTQAANCYDGKKGACSPGAFLKAGLIGGAVGGLAGLGGALGGKLLTAVGGRVINAVGGLFRRAGAEAVEGMATDATEAAVAESAEATGESAAISTAGESSTRSATEEMTEAGGGDAARPTSPGESPRYSTPPTRTLQGKINPSRDMRNCGPVACAGDRALAGEEPIAVPPAIRGLRRDEMEKAMDSNFVRMENLSSLLDQVRSWGSGARGIVGGFPEEVGSAPGHYFNVVNNIGQIAFLDFQRGIADRVTGWGRYFLMRTN